MWDLIFDNIGILCNSLNISIVIIDWIMIYSWRKTFKMLLDLTKWSQQRPKNWVGLVFKKIYQELGWVSQPKEVGLGWKIFQTQPDGALL